MAVAYYCPPGDTLTMSSSIGTGGNSENVAHFGEGGLSNHEHNVEEETHEQTNEDDSAGGVIQQAGGIKVGGGPKDGELGGVITHETSKVAEPEESMAHVQADTVSEGTSHLMEFSNATRRDSIASFAIGPQHDPPHTSLPQTPAQFAGLDVSMDPSFSTVSEFGREFARLATTPAPGLGAQTPVGFGVVGQTPLTAASFGSSAGEPTPPTDQNTNTIGFKSKFGSVRPGTNIPPAAGLSGAGLIRGNDPLQPTPVVRRKEPERKRQLPTPSPGMHYHTTMTQSIKKPASPQKKMRRNLETVEEEDPSMLRYESRPGSDQSPLATKDQDRSQEIDNESQQLPTPRLSAPIQPASPAETDPIPPPEQFKQEDTQIEQEEPSSSAVPSLKEFPFFFDGYGAWVCRHCAHVPPYYRGANYVWQYTNAPPNSFVDHHLRFCPGLNPSLLPLPQQQQPPPPSSSYSLPYPSRMPPPPSSGASGNYPYPVQQPSAPYGQAPPPQRALAQKTRPPLQAPYHPHAQKLPPSRQMAPPLYNLPVSAQVKRESGVQGNLNHPQYQPSSVRRAPDPPGTRKPSGNEREIEAPTLKSARQPYFPGQPFQRPPPQYPYPSNFPPQSLFPPPHVMSQGHRPPHLPHLAPRLPVGDRDPSEVMSPSGRPKRKPGAKSPRGRETDDATYSKAIEHLNQRAAAMPKLNYSEVGSTLVEESDGDLLTDYFFHLMQQLVVCRFSEKDRKTRGGKRENINVGYGGLQCVHCKESSGSRKFFWSNVDRLANSFAEIPGHILKCKQCPDDAKDALLILKGRHPDQMQMLPRGSQKVFFRRMWRRLHEGGDSKATPTKDSRSSLEESESSTVSAEASQKSLDVATEAAQILAKSLEEGSLKSPESREMVLLAIPEDKDWLSDMDCFVRKNIEVFAATKKDVAVAAADRKYPIKVGQVGIRCIHCAVTSHGANGAAVSYPYSISGIYESVREFHRLHLDVCQNLPPDMRQASQDVKGAASLSSVLRRYYVQAAMALGLHDTAEGGIRAGAKPEPMSSAGFQSPSSSFRLLSGVNYATLPGAQKEFSIDLGRKRKASSDDNEHEPEAKRQDSKEEEGGKEV